MWSMCRIAVLVSVALLVACADVGVRDGDGDCRGYAEKYDLQWYEHAADKSGRAEYYCRLMRDIREGRASVDYVDRAGRPILNSAISYGGMEEINMLLEMGADPDGGDGRLVPPLARVVLPCDLEKAKLLLRYGADPNATEAMGGLPIIYVSIMGGDLRCFELLVEHGADATRRNTKPIAIEGSAWFVIAPGKQGFVDRLWELGADLMLENWYGMNAVEYAIMRGDEYAPMLSGVIEKKRRAAGRDSDSGDDAYFAAIDRGDQEAVMELWEQGRHPRDSIRDGINAMEYSIVAGKWQLFQPIAGQMLQDGWRMRKEQERDAARP